MKIIFTVDTYYPMKDGVQAVTQYHAEGLARKGYDVTVITTKNDSSVVTEVHNGVSIVRVNARTKHSMYFGDKKEYRDLIIKETNDSIALINVCTQVPLTDWLFPMLRGIKCKKILYVHGMFDKRFHRWDFDGIKVFSHKVWNNIRWGLYYNFIGKYVRQYDTVVQLHCFDLANIFFQRKYRINSFQIGNAAEDVFFAEIEKHTPSIINPHIVYVANYMERKNQERALRVFYKANLPLNVGLVFVGSEKNSYYERLLDTKRKLDIEYGAREVSFLYNLSREETVKIIKSAVINLMTSRWEAFPVSILEGLAAGVPFISTDVGCVRFLPGGMIAYSDDDFAYLITMFMRNDGMRASLGKTGYEYACMSARREFVTNQLEQLILK